MNENLNNEGELGMIKRARDYVGERGIGSDSMNILLSLNAMLEDTSQWSTINRISTYEEYVRNHPAKNNKQLTDAIMRLSDPHLVQELDDVIQQINQKISSGVTTQEQADDIKRFLIKAQGIIYGA